MVAVAVIIARFGDAEAGYFVSALTRLFAILLDFSAPVVYVVTMSRRIFQLTAGQIQALQSGDKQLFRQLFMEFQPRLFRFLWLKLRSVELAEDLVQETFLRVWRTRQRLQPDRNFEIYLFRIASNLATDTLRQQKRQPQRTGLDKAPLLDPQTSESAAEYHELTHRIDSIIAGLPEGPKAAFILHRYEDLSHAEISAILGISVKTVEKHISKALQVLREALTKLDLLPKANQQRHEKNNPANLGE